MRKRYVAIGLALVFVLAAAMPALGASPSKIAKAALRLAHKANKNAKAAQTSTRGFLIVGADPPITLTTGSDTRLVSPPQLPAGRYLVYATADLDNDGAAAKNASCILKIPGGTGYADTGIVGLRANGAGADQEIVSMQAAGVGGKNVANVVFVCRQVGTGAGTIKATNARLSAIRVDTLTTR